MYLKWRPMKNQWRIQSGRWDLIKLTKRIDLTAAIKVGDTQCEKSRMIMEF